MGQKIKLARKAVGYSQKQLADVLKVSDKAVSTYEVGRATPTLVSLRKISEVTGKPFTYFVEDQAEQDETLKVLLKRIEQEFIEVKKLLYHDHTQKMKQEQSTGVTPEEN